MAPDGRIDTYARLRVPNTLLQPRKLFVELLAHAVEALELELTLSGQCLHLADRIRVVRSERRVDDIGRVKELLGAGEVRDVGRDLPREHGIVS